MWHTQVFLRVSAAHQCYGCVWRIWPHAHVTHTGTPALMAAEHMWTRYTQRGFNRVTRQADIKKKLCSFGSGIYYVAVEDVIPLPVPPTPVQHITYPEWKSTPPCCCGGLHSISRVYSVVCGIQGCQRHQDWGRVVVVWCCGLFINEVLRPRCTMSCLPLILQSSRCS